jgi:predicted ABC-type ATPase
MLKPKGMPFINADIIAKEAFPDDPVNNSHKAARIAEELRFDKLRQGHSFCFETVFSHVSKIDFIATAKATGYHVILVFLHVDDTDLNQARVSQRVIDGGHDVPTDKILSRIPRTLDNVKAAIPLCDEVHMLDNSRLDDPFKRVISIINGQVTAGADTSLPSWVLPLIGE